MTRDANGRTHKPAGTPAGGQYDTNSHTNDDTDLDTTTLLIGQARRHFGDHITIRAVDEQDHTVTATTPDGHTHTFHADHIPTPDTPMLRIYDDHGNPTATYQLPNNEHPLAAWARHTYGDHITIQQINEHTMNVTYTTPDGTWHETHKPYATPPRHPRIWEPDQQGRLQPIDTTLAPQPSWDPDQLNGLAASLINIHHNIEVTHVIQQHGRLTMTAIDHTRHDRERIVSIDNPHPRDPDGTWTLTNHTWQWTPAPPVRANRTPPSRPATIAQPARATPTRQPPFNPRQLRTLTLGLKVIRELFRGFHPRGGTRGKRGRGA